MSVEQKVYNTPPPLGKARTLASLHKCCHFSKPEKHLESINAPLLELEPSQYVLDELHILLRVADVLMRNLILLADHLDHKQKHRVGTCGQHVKMLQDMVNACGVSFVISPVSCLLKHMLNTKLHNGLHQATDENGKAVKGMYDWTSLTRSQNLKVFERLPDKLVELLPDDDAAQLSALWKV